jgi:hypothetical protein
MPGIRIRRQQGDTKPLPKQLIVVEGEEVPTEAEGKFYLFQNLRNDFSKKSAQDFSRRLLFHDLLINRDIRRRFMQRYSLGLPSILDFNYSGEYSDGGGSGPLIFSDVIDQLGRVEFDAEGKGSFAFTLNEQYSRFYLYAFREIITEYEEKLKLKFSRRLRRAMRRHAIHVQQGPSGTLVGMFEQKFFMLPLGGGDRTALESLMNLINEEVIAAGREGYDRMLTFIEQEVEKNAEVAEEPLRYAMAHFTEDGYLRFSPDGKRVRTAEESSLPADELVDIERYPEPLLKFKIDIS